MSTHTHNRIQAPFDVKDVNRTLVNEGFLLKKGDVKRVIELLKAGRVKSIQEAAQTMGLKQTRETRPHKLASQALEEFRPQSVSGYSCERKEIEEQEILVSFIVQKVFMALDSQNAEERFLRLVVEEAVEGHSARIFTPAETGEARWRVESQSRLHVLSAQTIEDFLTQPAPGYYYEGKELDEQEIILLAGEMIEVLFAETTLHVIDKTREEGPEWAKALIPCALDKERYDQFFEQIFDAITDESEANSKVVARLAEVAKLPFKETVLKYRPEAAERIRKDTEGQALKSTAMRNAMEKLDVEAEHIRKVFLGNTGERLPKRRVAELVNAIIERVDSLEGLFLALELMRHDRVVSCFDRTGQAFLADYTKDCDMAFSHFPVLPQGPLAKLFFRLNKERVRSRKKFWVSALDSSGMVFRFDEAQWGYFMAWALTAGLDSSEGPISVVVRREETLMAAGSERPMMSVAALLINGMQVHRLSAEEMLKMHTTDAQTGEALEPEPGVRCVAFSSLCPGLFEPTQGHDAA